MSSESLDIYGLKPHALSSVLDTSSESSISPEIETVPPKLYDVEVVQFWRGEKEPLQPYPLHWAIYVETSPGIGNTYQLVGNQTNYAIDIRISQPLENSEDLRGSHSVGSGFSGIIGETKLACLQDNMCWLLEGWPEIENAVEFVGDSEDLACVLSNRRSARVHRCVWKLHANTRALIDEVTVWLSSRTERN
ncbi:uncharacterized protein BJ212DRAFT_1585691 [Suillus subaureus]|uniref:Uncharacterized protein n=1 Tax=Suillus subaureus TaxID=48587 RepID=A0A9P7EI20_9AGAM|nr:uncharacterized protein BJ212DRAFT_1585691 [Suillus subaureus]KAG1821677.1 hypothetical protein BJ212DRAFT_1585691 [Suillus subaureus]